MTVVECPACGSKFKINKDILLKETVKMRCSVCAHVFLFSTESEGEPDKDFDLLITTSEGGLEERPVSDAVPQDFDSTVADTDIEEKPDPEEVQPESVIREIDSILGAGEEISSGDERLETAKESGKARALKVGIILTLVIIVLAGAVLWVMRDSLPFSGLFGQRTDQPVLEKGPFFSIPEESVTYEILDNDNDGSMLIVKGVIRKLSEKPLKSVMVEARVYDRDNRLLEGRNTYAGIIPESGELVRQKSSEIDSLLTAEPRTLGVLATSADIPFAVAFFGKPAREGASFQVEVREFHWN